MDDELSASSENLTGKSSKVRSDDAVVCVTVKLCHNCSFFNVLSLTGRSRSKAPEESFLLLLLISGLFSQSTPWSHQWSYQCVGWMMKWRVCVCSNRRRTKKVTHRRTAPPQRSTNTNRWVSISLCLCVMSTLTWTRFWSSVHSNAFVLSSERLQRDDEKHVLRRQTGTTDGSHHITFLLTTTVTTIILQSEWIHDNCPSPQEKKADSEDEELVDREEQSGHKQVWKDSNSLI